jgi:hypothetical protein
MMGVVLLLLLQPLTSGCCWLLAAGIIAARCMPRSVPTIAYKTDHNTAMSDGVLMPCTGGRYGSWFMLCVCMLLGQRRTFNDEEFDR